MNMPNIKVDLPRVHMAGSDAHHNAHLEVGQHGFSLFLSPDAEYPLLDIDGTPAELDDLVRALNAALASRTSVNTPKSVCPVRPTRVVASEHHLRSDSAYQTVCGTFTSLAASGRSIVKTQPFPGMLRTWISPAFARTAWRAIESPRPSPERSVPRRSPNA